jgi:hypothetical protein
MGIIKINNIFSKKQINFLKNIIINTDIPKLENGDYAPSNRLVGVDNGLGRLISTLKLEDILSDIDITNKLITIATNILNEEVVFDHAMSAIYSSKYGKPNLPPHFDGDKNDLVVNFQLSSNTSWDLGLDLETHTIDDNSAIAFNANEIVHWRPHKNFNEGEYVHMVFFRFYKMKNRTDYSNVPMNQISEVFQDVVKLRESLLLDK